MKAAPKRRVLLFGDEATLRPATRVIACQGAEFLVEGDPSQIKALTVAQRPDILIVDLSYIGPNAVVLMDSIAHLCSGTQFICLADPSPPNQMIELLERSWFGHLIGLKSPWFTEEFGATLAKMLGRDIFGLNSYLPWSVRPIEHRVRGSADKAVMFDELATYLGQIGIRGRLVQRIQGLADELLMNAIYDAPYDRQTGLSLYVERTREEPVVLRSDACPLFRFGCDGRTLGISITDPFGGLRPAVVKRYIQKGLRRGDDQIDEKVGGAGLGLYLLFNGFNSMIVNISPRQCTEVIGLIDIRGRVRQMLQAPKSLNIFLRQRGPDDSFIG